MGILIQVKNKIINIKKNISYWFKVLNKYSFENKKHEIKRGYIFTEKNTVILMIPLIPIIGN